MEGWRRELIIVGEEMRSDAQAEVQKVRSISGSRVHVCLLSLRESPAEV